MFDLFDESDLPPSARSGVAKRIAQHAREHFASFGYSTLTMDNLSHDLGISKKTLYAHFPGKDAIIGLVIDAFGRSLHRRLSSILDDKSLSFPDKLHAVISFISSRISKASPAMLRDLQRFAPDLYLKIEGIRQKVIPDIFTRLLREGIEKGLIRTDIDPNFAAEFWLHSIQGLMHPKSLDRLSLTPDQVFHRAINLFVGGILTPSGRKDYENHLKSCTSHPS